VVDLVVVLITEKLVVLTSVARLLRVTTKKGRQLFGLAPNIFL